jgi:hypothetical protein
VGWRWPAIRSKASIRLAVNTSPEPFSNVAISLAEDLAVALVVWLATDHPWLAAGWPWCCWSAA